MGRVSSPPDLPPPPKTNMTVENLPFEDVITNGRFSNVMLVYQMCIKNSCEGVSPHLKKNVAWLQAREAVQHKDQKAWAEQIS